MGHGCAGRSRRSFAASSVLPTSDARGPWLLGPSLRVSCASALLRFFCAPSPLLGASTGQCLINALSGRLRAGCAAAGRVIGPASWRGSAALHSRSGWPSHAALRLRSVFRSHHHWPSAPGAPGSGRGERGRAHRRDSGCWPPNGRLALSRRGPGNGGLMAFANQMGERLPPFRAAATGPSTGLSTRQLCSAVVMANGGRMGRRGRAAPAPHL
jgi:hypothetical protein